MYAYHTADSYIAKVIRYNDKKKKPLKYFKFLDKIVKRLSVLLYLKSGTVEKHNLNLFDFWIKWQDCLTAS